MEELPPHVFLISAPIIALYGPLREWAASPGTPPALKTAG
jgi:hypothetical protein